MGLRKPAVAGYFYPGDKEALAREVEGLLAQARTPPEPRARGVLSPHAGYRYAGRVMAEGFRPLAAWRGRARRVFLLGPSHFVPFWGVALFPHRAWATPLGEVAVDREGVERLLALGKPFWAYEAPFWEEHSLEVLLPFLQRLLPETPILPLLFGDVDPKEVAEALRPHGGREDLLVASSDLSHHHPDPVARALDGKTLERALALDAEGLAQSEACGRLPWASLTHLARGWGWGPRLLAYATSAEAGGGRERVVGYAAMAYLGPEEGPEPGDGKEEDQIGQGEEEPRPRLSPSGLGKARMG